MESFSMGSENLSKVLRALLAKLFFRCSETSAEIELSHAEFFFNGTVRTRAAFNSGGGCGVPSHSSENPSENGQGPPSARNQDG
jgi:hypothetical protein